MNKYYLQILLLIPVILTAQQDSVWVTFNYKTDAQHSVYLTGSFNDWSADKTQMIYSGDRWTIGLRLAPGYYYYKFIDNGNWVPDPANKLKINDGGKSFNSIIKVGEPKKPLRKKSTRKFLKNLVPRPILANNPDWIKLYYAAWEMAWAKIKKGNASNGFVKYYMDEGFNDLIYQWDTDFIAAFAMYARNMFPAMQSLDNFYLKQRKDGYIQRVYREKDGSLVAEPTKDEPMINPPLFAWVELKYFQNSNDTSRLKSYFPNLNNYFQWIEKNCRSEHSNGLYYNTQLGSGMDNVPRKNVGKAIWVDLSSQQALAAKCLYEIAEILGDKTLSAKYEKKYQELSALINQYCWDDNTGFYRDVREDGSKSSTTHVGGFWPLMSEVCPPENFLTIRDILTNSEEFWRPHVVPTLSASDKDYDPKGHYWLGGVWGPTNYMVVKGLEVYGDYQLSHRIAHNHISSMTDVYLNFIPEENQIAYEERYGDGYSTIWECYSPEKIKPATRWDNTFYSRQDFVGMSGLGPIAMLIENIIGINLRADKNYILWHIMRDDKHGVNNLLFGDQQINLLCTPNDEYAAFEIFCKKGFDLEIVWNDNVYHRKINSGLNLFRIQ